MAYNISKRFPSPPKAFNIFEPGAYQNVNSPIVNPNKVPFLLKTERNTDPGAKIWTHAIYDAGLPRKIPNCTSFLSKSPRFQYELLDTENEDAILCQCGNEEPCQCNNSVLDKETKEVVCQAKIPHRIFKGFAPRPTLGSGLSAPSKRDYGFKVLPNGTKIRLFKKNKDDSPPFYDTRIVESTSFYQGCKWSKWISRRTQKEKDDKPGPADYMMDSAPSYDVICAEKVRALKRKTSKQYRFIEMVQRRNIVEGLPGPANYTLSVPKGTNLKSLGSKAERFIDVKYNESPGPTEYFIIRDFDRIGSPRKPCHAKLPSPAVFGVKSVRFKPQREEGPSPTSYNVYYRPCISKNCNLVPFGSNSQRFKDTVIEDQTDEDIFLEVVKDKADYIKSPIPNQHPTWEFKSNTIRMKPLLKKNDEPSPADLPQMSNINKRSQQFQYNCPFFSSDGRFQSWFNWIPVHGKEGTPGPAYYCLDKPKCQPAFNSGPLYRSQRFSAHNLLTPAPNSYNAGVGIEGILSTHNLKLKTNVSNKHKYHWIPPEKPRKLSIDEQESILLNKSIALLDVHDVFQFKKSEVKKIVPPVSTSKKTKLLRCFLHTRQTPTYF